MAVNLFHSFIPLFLSLLFGIICFREVFQFKNITMIRLVMRHVGQPGEVTVAILEFQFGSWDIENIQT